jgi:hypothetical protein
MMPIESMRGKELGTKLILQLLDVKKKVKETVLATIDARNLS